MHSHKFLIALATSSLAACVGDLNPTVETGDGPSPNGPGSPEPNRPAPAGENQPDAEEPVVVEVVDYSLTLAPNTEINEINLGEQLAWTATVSSENFAGTVNLKLEGTMEGWEVTYSPAESITLTKGQTAEVIISVQVATNALAGPAALDFVLDGELGPRAASSEMLVANRVLLSIPMGTGEGNHSTFDGSTLLLRTGTEVVVVNDDNVNHRIHADDHQEGAMSNGESYSLTMNDRGIQSAYCHIHEANVGVINFAVDD